VAQNAMVDTVLAMIAPRAELCILEHPYMAALIAPIRAMNPEVRFVYSAHNVEAVHRPLMLAEHESGPALAPIVALLERTVLENAALVVCCTYEDAEILDGRAVPALVVLNGCNAVADAPVDAPLQHHRVGFIGSAHRPNVEAALFVVADLAPAFSDVMFEFIGGICSELPSDIPNVVLHGIVDAEKKSDIMREWSVALNPVSSGGGSSLKLPDFLAHGLPIISTPEGSRGFDLRLRGASILVARNGFAEALRALLDDVQGRRDLARRGLAYAADSLRWSILTSPYRKAIQRLLVTSKAPEARSLLVIASGYGQPGAVGNDILLDDIAGALRGRFTRIDLASADRTGRPPLSFTGSAPDPARTALRRLGAPFDGQLFFPPADAVDDEGKYLAERGARATWMAQGVAAAGRLAAHLPLDKQYPRLLGGLYSREWDGTRHFYWSCGRFGCLLPRGTVLLRLTGHNNENKPIAIRIRAVDGEEWIDSRSVTGGAFSISLALPKGLWDQAVLCEFAMDVHEARPDLRLFGIVVYQVTVSCLPQAGLDDSSATCLLDTEIDLDDPLATGLTQATAWPEIEAPPSADLRTMLVAPSPSLAAYAAAAIARYDTILVCRSATALAQLDMASLQDEGAEVIEYIGDYRIDPLLASLLGMTTHPKTRAIVAMRGISGDGKTLSIPARRYALPAVAAEASTSDSYVLIPVATPNRRTLAVIGQIAAYYRSAGLPGQIAIAGTLSDDMRDLLGLPVYEAGPASLAGASAIVVLDPDLDLEATIVGAWSRGRPVLACRAIAGATAILADETDLLFDTPVQAVSALSRLVHNEGERVEATLDRFAWRNVAERLAAFVVPPVLEQPITDMAASLESAA